MSRLWILSLLVAVVWSGTTGDFGPRKTLFKSSRELLEKHGLGEIAGALGSILHMFDAGVHLFSCLNDREQLDVLNNLVVCFKHSYIEAVGKIEASGHFPKGTLSMAEMRDLLRVQRMILHQNLSKDPRIRESEWFQFVSQVDLVFVVVERVYEMMVDAGLGVTWFMVSMASPILSLVVPEHPWIKPDLLGNVQSYPEDFRDRLHGWVEAALTSNFAPSLRLFVSLANRTIREHLEL